MERLERDLIDARFRCVDLQENLVELMREALTYRSCFIVTLDLLAARARQVELLSGQLQALRDELRRERGFADPKPSEEGDL